MFESSAAVSADRAHSVGKDMLRQKWKERYESLEGSNFDATSVTERGGMASITMALSVLAAGLGALDDDRSCKTSPWHDRGFRGKLLMLLAETVSRSARSFIRWRMGLEQASEAERLAARRQKRADSIQGGFASTAEESGRNTFADSGKERVITERTVSRQLIQRALQINEERLAARYKASFLTEDASQALEDVRAVAPAIRKRKSSADVASYPKDFLENMDWGVLDVDQAQLLKESSKFFGRDDDTKHGRTNCSPFAFVGAVLLAFPPPIDILPSEYRTVVERADVASSDSACARRLENTEPFYTAAGLRALFAGGWLVLTRENIPLLAKDISEYVLGALADQSKVSLGAGEISVSRDEGCLGSNLGAGKCREMEEESWELVSGGNSKSRRRACPLIDRDAVAECLFSLVDSDGSGWYVSDLVSRLLRTCTPPDDSDDSRESYEGGLEKLLKPRLISGRGSAMRLFLDLLLQGHGTGVNHASVEGDDGRARKRMRDEFQEALYLQGIAFHNAELREAAFGGAWRERKQHVAPVSDDSSSAESLRPSPSGPVPVMREWSVRSVMAPLAGDDRWLYNPHILFGFIAKEEWLRVLGDVRVLHRSKQAQHDAEARACEMLQMQRMYVREWHSRPPKLFTPEQVALENRNRPVLDQLRLDKLSNTGLLQYHCAHEKCPEYLKDLRTEKEKQRCAELANICEAGELATVNVAGMKTQGPKPSKEREETQAAKRSTSASLVPISSPRLQPLGLHP